MGVTALQRDGAGRQLAPVRAPGPSCAGRAPPIAKTRHNQRLIYSRRARRRRQPSFKLLCLVYEGRSGAKRWMALVRAPGHSCAGRAPSIPGSRGFQSLICARRARRGRRPSFKLIYLVSEGRAPRLARRVGTPPPSSGAEKNILEHYLRARAPRRRRHH